MVVIIRSLRHTGCYSMPGFYTFSMCRGQHRYETSANYHRSNRNEDWQFSMTHNFELRHSTVAELFTLVRHECGRRFMKKIYKHTSRWGPSQEFHFFYKPSHLSALQSCKSTVSTNFCSISIFK